MRIFCSVSLISLETLVLFGCASTHFQVTGQVAQQPLCQPPGEQPSAIVLWGPKWRPDQEGVLRREAAAQRGIEQFFSTSECFAAEVPGLTASYASDPVTFSSPPSANPA